MNRLAKGDFVEIDGLVAVVVGTDNEPSVPEDHVLLWYGEPNQVRKSECPDAYKIMEPIAYLVPAEYCTNPLTAKIEH